ncbi:MAG: 4'-phosphopantetheinyl transferase superfamily protein [Acidobacteriaceae bacterium]|nr:4'-phosphopantetheinyl transferase superfamily protein [Acidobacteriaceae bacterium]MBV9781122.1 4'-phosphopantetheinyl transferase superfamily protein [Acidobacteriaceae bacterium]
MYAFTEGCELGIDVEQIREHPDIHSIAESFFCPEELLKLESLTWPTRLASFFACWTRKEAYLKATGQGLRASLDSVQVTLLPTEPPAILDVNGSASEARLWSLCDLHPAPGYVGALALRSKRAVRMFRYITVDQLLASLPSANMPDLDPDFGFIGCKVA